MRFNPPPNWPQPPKGWTPPPDWEPDPSWGPPPPGHQLWIDDNDAGGGSHAYGGAPKKKKKSKAKIALYVVGALLGLTILGGLLGDDEEAATPTAVEQEGEQPAAVEEPPAAVEEPPAAEEPAEETEAAPEPEPEPEQPAEPGIGVPVRDGQFEFTVTGVERVGNTVGEDFLAETAQGEFIIVRVDVTNIGDEPQMLDSSSQTLINEQGQELAPSSALFVLEDAQRTFLENINPGNSVTGAPLLFDVAPGTVLDSIELHDSLLSGGVTVDLTGS